MYRFRHKLPPPIIHIYIFISPFAHLLQVSFCFNVQYKRNFNAKLVWRKKIEKKVLYENKVINKIDFRWEFFVW